VNKIPYFETKVVKVKKEKKESYIGKKYALYTECKFCGEPIYHECKKTNIVNGENLDKIKFPCFCSYGNNRLGMITSGTPTYENYEYILHNIGSQSGCSALTRSGSLGGLIKNQNIHILKGKIILFEEE